MPFYEYECPHCKFYQEVLQKISDPPLKKCPSCGQSGFKRLISAPVFRLKGSGWYETDFKSDKENKRNLVGEDREAKPAAAESKPDTKADVGPVKETKTETAAPKAEPAASGEAKSSQIKAGKPPRGRQRRTTAKAPVRRVARKPK